MTTFIVPVVDSLSNQQADLHSDTATFGPFEVFYDGIG